LIIISIAGTEAVYQAGREVQQELYVVVSIVGSQIHDIIISKVKGWI